MAVQVRVCGRAVAVLCRQEDGSVGAVVVLCACWSCMHRQLKWWLCGTGSPGKGRKMGADKYSCYETGMDE